MTLCSGGSNQIDLKKQLKGNTELMNLNLTHFFIAIHSFSNFYLVYILCNVNSYRKLKSMNILIKIENAGKAQHIKQYLWKEIELMFQIELSSDS